MKKTIILVILSAVLTGCFTDNKDAYRVLEEQGYTNIKLTGYECFGCADSDLYSTGFTATSPAGKVVKGVVCKGVFKGSTIRIF